MKTQFVVSNQTNPYWNIAVENYLLSLPESETITLYLWRNHRTVVIGQNQNPFSECNVEALEADGGYLMRRKTGGGAVYHDDGNINFSFVVPKKYYDQTRQFSVIQRAVLDFGIASELSGRNDLLAFERDRSGANGATSTERDRSGANGATSTERDRSGANGATSTERDRSGANEASTEGRKFSGNAFSRGRYQDLHHGTILIKGNIEDLQRYLKPKPAKLLKHGVDSVRSRVVNLSEINPEITSENIVPHLKAAFEEIYGMQAVTLDFKDIITHPEVRKLYDEFASDEWRYNKWKNFTAQRSAQFEWGGVEVSLDISNGVIRGVRIASDALDTESIEKARNLLCGASVSAVPPRQGNIVVDDIVSLLF